MLQILEVYIIIFVVFKKSCYILDLDLNLITASILVLKKLANN